MAKEKRMTAVEMYGDRVPDSVIWHVAQGGFLRRTAKTFWRKVTPAFALEERTNWLGNLARKVSSSEKYVGAEKVEQLITSGFLPSEAHVPMQPDQYAALTAARMRKLQAGDPLEDQLRRAHEGILSRGKAYLAARSKEQK